MDGLKLLAFDRVRKAVRGVRLGHSRSRGAIGGLHHNRLPIDTWKLGNNNQALAVSCTSAAETRSAERSKAAAERRLRMVRGAVDGGASQA